MKNLLLQGMIQKIVFALLFITGALLYAQLEKTYVSSQTNQVSGICVGCAVGDPQNIVGNNENNYETLRMPIGVLGRIEQNLNFPKLAPAYRKVTIGIETPNVSIKEQAKREIYIETFKDNVSNHPPMRVDISMLKPSSNSQKGTIEFTTTRPFDRIKLSVHSGLVGVGEEIRIYYMHHLPAPFTVCGNPPLDPLAYYSFDGNTNDIISDYNLIGSGFDFLPNDMICGSAIYADSNQKLLKMFFKGNKIKTIAFWVKADNPSGDTSLRPKFTIHTNKMFIEGENFSSQSFKIYLKEQVTIYPLFKERAIDTIEYDEFTHLIITYNEETNQACIYKNGLLSDIYETRSCGAFENFTFPTNKSLGITLRNTKIDELLLYDRALTRDEVKALACSYGKIPGCTSGTSSPASKITASTETFTVSPNPTTGEITLAGNVLLIGSDISIRNTSGIEIYHSPFRSKTFELPATLPGGVYMLTLQTKDKKVYTRKIILTR